MKSLIAICCMLMSAPAFKQEKNVWPLDQYIGPGGGLYIRPGGGLYTGPGGVFFPKPI